MTVGPDGTIYLAGTTTGTFAGQQRNVAECHQRFCRRAQRQRHGQLDPAIWRRRRASPPARPSRSIPTAPACWTRWACRSGTINLNQSVDLTQQTTLRAGDSFQIKIEGVAPRTATITIDPGETLDSLVTKINAELGRPARPRSIIPAAPRA